MANRSGSVDGGLTTELLGVCPDEKIYSAEEGYTHGGDSFLVRSLTPPGVYRVGSNDRDVRVEVVNPHDSASSRRWIPSPCHGNPTSGPPAIPDSLVMMTAKRVAQPARRRVGRPLRSAIEGRNGKQSSLMSCLLDVLVDKHQASRVDCRSLDVYRLNGKRYAAVGLQLVVYAGP